MKNKIYILFLLIVLLSLFFFDSNKEKYLYWSNVTDIKEFRTHKQVACIQKTSNSILLAYENFEYEKGKKPYKTWLVKEIEIPTFKTLKSFPIGGLDNLDVQSFKIERKENNFIIKVYSDNSKSDYLWKDNDNPLFLNSQGLKETARLGERDSYKSYEKSIELNNYQIKVTYDQQLKAIQFNSRRNNSDKKEFNNIISIPLFYTNGHFEICKFNKTAILIQNYYYDTNDRNVPSVLKFAFLQNFAEF